MVGVGVTCENQNKSTPEEKEVVSPVLTLGVPGQSGNLSLKNGILDEIVEDLFLSIGLGILTLKVSVADKQGISWCDGN